MRIRIHIKKPVGEKNQITEQQSTDKLNLTQRAIRLFCVNLYANRRAARDFWVVWCKEITWSL